MNRTHDGEQTPIEDKLREGATVLDEPFHHDAIANDMLLAADEITQLRQQRSTLEQGRDEWKLKACTDHPNADRDWVCVECVETSVDQALQQATRAGFAAGKGRLRERFETLVKEYLSECDDDADEVAATIQAILDDVDVRDSAADVDQQPSSPRPDHGEGS